MKRVMPKGVVAGVKWAFIQYRRRIESGRTVRGLLRQGDDIRLEIGAGRRRRGWYTLDRNLDCDICWDLKDGIPFPDESVQCIYASHVLEHFAHPELIELLRDCRRTLKPNGWLSVCVPSAEPYISAYANDVVLDEQQFLRYQSAYYGESSIDYINYIAYMDGQHRYMFDETNLVGVLQRAGFSGCRLRDFDPGVDSEARRIGSIYAIAERGIR